MQGGGMTKRDRISGGANHFHSHFVCRWVQLAGVIDDMMWNELESALDDDEIEEEEEDCKVLSELAGETAAQLRAAAHRGHTTKNMFLLKPSFSPTV
ncbi:unnamed protein product [Sphagnum jensenii]|uniref:Uncharacterized protein n=1 Tax=Sphagnum jensenii TaxID=128206 RepID=A0ABP1AG75_9BRYO